MSTSLRDSECDPTAFLRTHRLAYLPQLVADSAIPPNGADWHPADTRAQPLHPVAYLWGSDPAHQVGIHVAQRDGYVELEFEFEL
jgi:hypothetical protein